MCLPMSICACVLVYADVYATSCILRSKNNYMSLFSLFTVCVLDIKPRFSGLKANLSSSWWHLWVSLQI